MLVSSEASFASFVASSLDGSRGTLSSGSPSGILRSVILITVGLLELGSEVVATESG